jgi:uncharacterized membrane protein
VPFHPIATWAKIEAGAAPGSRGILWPLIILTAVIVVGIVVIVWADRWRKRPVELSLTPAEQMARFQELYDRGELSQQEFDRIKARLDKNLRAEPPVPPQANGSPTA